jgi:hypothetical protein
MGGLPFIAHKVNTFHTGTTYFPENQKLWVGVGSPLGQYSKTGEKLVQSEGISTTFMNTSDDDDPTTKITITMITTVLIVS